MRLAKRMHMHTLAVNGIKTYIHRITTSYTPPFSLQLHANACPTDFRARRTRTLTTNANANANANASRFDCKMTVTQNLQPALVWKHFETLASIPRPSKLESKVLDYIKVFADNKGLEWQQDDFGNMVVRRPGSSGGETAPTVIVQGHVDMVCEKEDSVEHDFSCDPIKLAVKDDWLTAVGTTLGADNGLGVAASLALLEMPSDVKLPPIEALFTVQEEIGLIGASHLDGSMLKGRILINMDAEDWPNIYIGCAGGGKTEATLKCKKQQIGSSHKAMNLEIGGLLSGHSGADIHLYRANAIKLSARILDALVQGVDCQVSDIGAGDKHNVIPRVCSASVFIASKDIEKAQSIVNGETESIMREYGNCEKSLSVELTEGDSGTQGLALDREDQRRLLALLNIIPHGPIKFSHSIANLVETSNNLASVKSVDSEDHREFVVTCSTRSSVDSAISAVRQQIKLLCDMCGGTTTMNTAYPGWQPNLDSDILKVTVDEVTKLNGGAPEITAIHAGLECGLIGEKLPGCDMVAFGPTILGAHTPDERVQISTVKPFWELVLNVVQNVAK